MSNIYVKQSKHGITLQGKTPESSSSLISWEQAILKFLKYAELRKISRQHASNMSSRLVQFQRFCESIELQSFQSVNVGHAREYLVYRMNQQIHNKYKFATENLSTTPAISTINREISLYTRFFQFCLEHEWIKRNPWRPIHRFPDPVKRQPRYSFNESEIESIFSVAGEFYDYYYLLLHTGIRPTDGFRLRGNSIKGSYLTFQMAKTGDWMVNIPIPSSVISQLSARISAAQTDDDLIFPELSADRQRKYCRRRVQEVFEPAFVREKFINLHTFRHTYAHNMLDRGMPKEVLQTFLGHRSIRTTEIYANWVKGKDLEIWVN